jgi:crossover junction endodeoxyribonuclease RuvC
MGVDPGLVVTGFGVIEIGRNGSILYCGSGVLRPQRLQSFPQRLQQIFHGLSQQIEKFTPELMAVENPFYAKNVKSAMLLGQARGVAILAAAEAGVEVQEYSPLEVKQAVVGYGRAAKQQVQAMIRSLLHAPRSLTVDAADALAVALCLAHSMPWQISLSTLGMQRSFSKSPEKTLAKRFGLGDVT